MTLRSEILSVTLLGCGLGCSESQQPPAPEPDRRAGAEPPAPAVTVAAPAPRARPAIAAATLDLGLGVEGGTVATFRGGEPVLLRVELRARGDATDRLDLGALQARASVQFLEIDASGATQESPLAFTPARAGPHHMFVAPPTEPTFHRALTLVATLSLPDIDALITSNPVLLHFGKEPWPGIDATPEHGLLRMARYQLACGEIDLAREILVKLAASTRMRAEALRFAADFFRQIGKTASAAEAERLLVLYLGADLKARDVPADHEPELPILPAHATSPELGDPLLTLLSKR
ncbi:MAG: hypothetical protein U1E76_04100 [Planctomycetota bacterium]